VRGRELAAFGILSVGMAACAGGAGADRPPTSAAAQGPTRAGTIELEGTFVKYTNFPCHRSDPYVGNELVVFHGSDGSRTTTVTGNASWIGLPADPPVAPLGQCRQVAPFHVTLPVADRYSVEINDGRLASLTLTEIRVAGLRVRLLVGDRPPSA
jgi:hypothetical protein